MKNTYRTADQADADKAQLVELHAALNAWPSALRRDEAGLWILRGRPGCYVSTWGDGKSWQLVVAPEEEISPLQWTMDMVQEAAGVLRADAGRRRRGLLPASSPADLR